VGRKLLRLLDLLLEVLEVALRLALRGGLLLLLRAVELQPRLALGGAAEFRRALVRRVEEGPRLVAQALQPLAEELRAEDLVDVLPGGLRDGQRAAHVA